MHSLLEYAPHIWCYRILQVCVVLLLFWLTSDITCNMQNMHVFFSGTAITPVNSVYHDTREPIEVSVAQ